MGSWRCSYMFCMMGATLWVLSLIHGSVAQTPSSCSNLSSLLSCLPYIEQGNSTRPASDCCTPLGSIITSDPTCLCQIAPLANQSGITINQTRAIEVATACNQTVPDSVVSCLSGVASSPSTNPSGTPTSPSTPPSQGGGNDSSDGSALLPPSLLLMGSIFVALLVHLISTST